MIGVDLDDAMLEPARRKAPHLRWVCADLATFDLGRRFSVVAMPGNVMIFCRPGDRAPIVARCAAHLEAPSANGPRGVLVAGFSLEGSAGALTVEEYDAACAAAGLVLVERYAGWSHEPFGPGADYVLSVHVASVGAPSPAPQG